MIACFVVFLLMSLCQHEILQKNQQQERLQLPATAPPRYRYRPPIPYNPIARFTFVGMPNVLCYHLTRFTPEEIARLLPLLGLHEIRF